MAVMRDAVAILVLMAVAVGVSGWLALRLPAQGVRPVQDRGVCVRPEPCAAREWFSA